MKFGTAQGRSRPEVSSAKCTDAYGRKGVAPFSRIFGTCDNIIPISVRCNCLTIKIWQTRLHSITSGKDNIFLNENKKNGEIGGGVKFYVDVRKRGGVIQMRTLCNRGGGGSKNREKLRM